MVANVDGHARPCGYDTTSFYDKQVMQFKSESITPYTTWLPDGILPIPGEQYNDPTYHSCIVPDGLHSKSGPDFGCGYDDSKKCDVTLETHFSGKEYPADRKATAASFTEATKKYTSKPYVSGCGEHDWQPEFLEFAFCGTLDYLSDGDATKLPRETARVCFGRQNIGDDEDWFASSPDMDIVCDLDSTNSFKATLNHHPDPPPPQPSAVSCGSATGGKKERYDLVLRSPSITDQTEFEQNIDWNFLQDSKGASQTCLNSDKQTADTIPKWQCTQDNQCKFRFNSALTNSTHVASAFNHFARGNNSSVVGCLNPDSRSPKDLSFAFCGKLKKMNKDQRGEAEVCFGLDN